MSEKKKEGLDKIWGEVTGKKEIPEKEKKSEKVSKSSDEKPTEETTPEQPVSTAEETPTKESSGEKSSISIEAEVEQPVVEESVEQNLWGESGKETSPPEKVEAPTVPSVPSVPTSPALPTPATVETEEYDTSPDSGSAKRVFTNYGLKGEGKTGLSLSFPGRVIALSFDRKTVQVWKELFKKAERITVYDAIRYLNKSSGEMWLKTADITLKYVNHLLNTEIKKAEPDWILIDGAQIFTQLCEMVMRYRNGLQPFQGIANRNLWKERRMYIDNIHNSCLAVAKEGIVYTTYTTQKMIHKDGQVINSKDVPKWIDAIMYYTDVVIRVRSKRGETGQVFTADVESSKTAKIRTGARVDITGTEGYKKLVGD